MGRSRSRSRSPRRGNERERERILIRSRSRSRERENRRRERDQRPERPERRREPERERPERVERGDRERPPMPRERRRSRSPSPSGRWPRGRSPVRRISSESPPPRKHSSSDEAPERREVDESQLEGKTEDEKAMMKMMGFCGFETTKGKAAEQISKPVLYPLDRKDSEKSDWLETSTEKRTVVIKIEKPVTATETRTISISETFIGDEKLRKYDERSSHSELVVPVSDSKAEIEHLGKPKMEKDRKEKKRLKAQMKHEGKVSSVSELSDSKSPSVKLEVASGDTHVVEHSKYGKENIAVRKVSLDNIPLPPSPPSETKRRWSLLPRSVSLNHVSSKPRSVSLNHVSSKPRSLQTSSYDENEKPVYVTPKRNPSPRSNSSHVTPGSHQASDTYTKSPNFYQQDTPKSHYRESPMSQGNSSYESNRSYEGNRSYETPIRRLSSVSKFSPATPVHRDGFSRYPATPHSLNQHASHCNRCFEEGHYFRDCRNPKRCRVCRVLGHYPGSPRCEYYIDDPYIVPFQGPGDILSNFYPCKITLYGKDFHSTEQAYQYKKAIEWNLTSVADQIMAAPTARDVKVLCSRVLKGPAGDHEEFKRSIMKDTLQAKASQVPVYRALLLDADPRTTFGEATMDFYWATGLVREETRKTRPDRWPGKNTLGKLHKEIGEQLKHEELSTGHSNEHYHDETAKEPLNRKDEVAEMRRKYSRRSSSSSSSHSSTSQVSSSSSDSESDSTSDSSSRSSKKRKRKQRSNSKESGRKTGQRNATSGKKSKGKKSKRKRNSSTSSSSDYEKGNTLAPTAPSLEDVEMPCKKKKSYS